MIIKYYDINILIIVIYYFRIPSISPIKWV